MIYEVIRESQLLADLVLIVFIISIWVRKKVPGLSLILVSQIFSFLINVAVRFALKSLLQIFPLKNGEEFAAFVNVVNTFLSIIFVVGMAQLLSNYPPSPDRSANNHKSDKSNQEPETLPR